MNLKKIKLLEDIYYNKNYISLYLRETQKLFEFRYTKNKDIFYNIAIKRPIDFIGNESMNEDFYDLETVYGYGGYYTNSTSADFIKEAMEHYKQRCEEENIIAEFIRFHPFNDFPVNFENIFNFCLYERDVIVVDLEVDILKSYQSKIRNTVKKNLDNLVVQQSYNIDKFYDIYLETMDKNNASDFYYFSKQLFKKYLELEEIRLYEVQKNNETISMGFFIFSNDIVHYHLSANTQEAYKLNANYVLLHKLFEISQKEGYTIAMLGGGKSSAKDDSLFRFKRKFSREMKNFYIAGMVFNEEKYNQFNTLWRQQSKKNVNFFLKYRMKLI